MYAADGRFLRTVPNAPSDFHGFVIRRQADGEFIYGATLRGQTIVKLALDGTVALTIPATAVPDDFKVRNRSLFTLHNVVLELTVTQGSDSERGSVRIPQLSPQAEIDVMEFNVTQDGGSVLVHGTVVADEGKYAWDQRL